MFDVVKTQGGWAVRKAGSTKVIAVFARALDAVAYREQLVAIGAK